MFGGANLDKSIDVVRWVYEAFSRGDVPAILASVANEVEGAARFCRRAF